MVQNSAPAWLVEDWRRSGIAEGDVVLVHSSMRRTMARLAEKEGISSPAVVVESIVEAVGSRGTALFPLFNFDFPKGVPFDMRSTPSQMGALTEAARLRPGAVRTGHPIYSFAVIGARAADFAGLCNVSGYADDSPFGILRRIGGKIAVIDLPDQHSMTYYHHVEEINNVDYRYFKTFTGEYTDLDGVTSTRSFKLFVRDLERGVKTSVDRMGELLWSQGLYHGDRPKQGSGMRTIDAHAMFQSVTRVILDGQAKDYLYETDPV